MPLRFTVLASGSSGNASLLEAGSFGLLIDMGLGPRKLASRMAAMGAAWHQVKAVLLSHTHGDHWNERTLVHLRRQRIPLYCHPGHQALLTSYGRAFNRLCQEKLVRSYTDGASWELAPGLTCQALPLCHDAGPTFGFRFERAATPGRPGWALAYVADLGSWTRELALALADVDVLAIEFNHDVGLECASGRSESLITRVLGDEGHLSNRQAAALLREVLRLSAPGRLRHVVQLHLSRDCNRALLAVAAAQATLDHVGVPQVHTTSQERPGPRLTLDSAVPHASQAPAPAPRWQPIPSPYAAQQWLPGWEAARPQLEA
jgi:phosphoribosyl 1,2-cyclic phosphodiesterase